MVDDTQIKTNSSSGSGFNFSTGIQVLNGLLSAYRERQNYRNAQQAQEYEKKLNDLKMQREDNAIQRYARDMQLAGYSKFQGFGASPSSAGSATSVPHYDYGSVGSALSGLSQAQEFDQLQQLRERDFELEKMKTGVAVKNSILDNIRKTIKLSSDLVSARIIDKKNRLGNEAQENLNKVIANDTEQYLSMSGTSKQVDASRITETDSIRQSAELSESVASQFGFNLDKLWASASGSANVKGSSKIKADAQKNLQRVYFRTCQYMTEAQKDFWVSKFDVEASTYEDNKGLNALVEKWARFKPSDIKQSDYIRNKKIIYMLTGGRLE